METARAHGSLRGRTLDPSPDDREVALEASLAERWRHLPDGIPSAIFLVIGGAALLTLLVVSGLLIAKVFADDGLGHADAALSRWFAAHRTTGLNQLTHYATLAAETMTIAALAVATVAVTAVVWRRWREPMLVATAVVGEVTIFVLITLMVDRKRPPVPHLDEAPPTSSFPSGHVAAAICMYGALAIIANERASSALVRGLFLALAVLVPLAVALSRLYRGMHYPTDVLGGVVLGLTWLYLVTRGIRLGVLHHQLRHRAQALRLGGRWRR
jgi:membrane-associated phospholipid phosphatase